VTGSISPLDSFNLHDRTILLTGGAGLLGREFAAALAAAQAHVVVADINQEAAQSLATEITAKSGVKALGLEMDVSDRSSVHTAVKQTLDTFGQIDVLINNAAIDPKFDPAHRVAHTGAFEDYPLELWNQSLAVNLTGMFLCAQAVAQPMLKHSKGVIINISSIYGLVGPDQRLYENTEDATPVYKPVTYSVTKSAVTGLTRYLATYWAGKNIRVNTLTLGGVFNQHEDEFVQRYSARTPLGRMAQRSEYNSALLFLASDASAYMTGANLVVDGGWTAW
jgi:NAD(P)-dependent dehydrogenase (short-subunit alcohol dehydrogenase family)